MFELIKSGGWLMLPLILCSITAMGIVGERFWSLQRKKVLPPQLIPQIWQLAQNNQINDTTIRQLRSNSPLGVVLAAGLVNRNHGREVMKSSIEETGRQVVHELERFLNTLGTIALISPLLGLLGTVTGIIQIFAAMGINGLGNPAVLASGIGVALITTATGLTVAIPSVFFHRYFERLVDEYVLKMEEESLKLLDIIHGDREKTMDFHRNKRSRTPVEINLIPMIDVVLVLLIFFIVTTTFTHETGININLPEANGEAAVTNEKVITLLIDQQGNYFISTKENESGQKLDPDTLKQDLTVIMGNAPQTPFVISADGKTPHQAVIKALDIASQVGFKHIAFATKEPEPTQ